MGVGKQPVSGGAGEAGRLPVPGTLILEAQAWSRGVWEMGSWRKGLRPRAQPWAASFSLAHSSARPAGTLRTHNSTSSKDRISSELYSKVMFPGGGNCLQKWTGLCLLRRQLSVRRRAKLHGPRSLSSSCRSGQEALVTHGPVPSTHMGPQTWAPAGWAWVGCEARGQAPVPAVGQLWGPRQGHFHTWRRLWAGAGGQRGEVDPTRSHTCGGMAAKGHRMHYLGSPGLRATSHPGQWTWNPGAPEKATIAPRPTGPLPPWLPGEGSAEGPALLKQ